MDASFDINPVDIMSLTDNFRLQPLVGSQYFQECLGQIFPIILR
jgi:hypothetical protein